METTLTIQLFWFAMALPVALEAYKAQGRARVILWVIAGVFGFMGFVWPVLSSGWPAIQAAGTELATNPAAWFAIAVALFFVLRPYWRRPSSRGTDPATIYDDRPIRKELEKIAEDRKAIIEDYQRMSGLEARLDAALGELLPLPPKVEEIRLEVVAARRDHEKLAGEHKKLHSRTGMSFIALQHREYLAELEPQIHQDAVELYDRLKAGETYNEQAWEQWENVHSHWNNLLDQWLATATWYAQKVKQRTLTVHDAQYGQKWTVSDNQFPNAEAVRRFRKFRIIYAQWQEVIPDVKRGMEGVAFLGFSDVEARRGEPAG